ncbi:MAG: hypothetical protein MZV63_51725 [Marinilabiliales bacterium]|nr:hypothetical protein [Marinilabiliales bacterium]
MIVDSAVERGIHGRLYYDLITGAGKGQGAHVERRHNARTEFYPFTLHLPSVPRLQSI